MAKATQSFLLTGKVRASEMWNVVQTLFDNVMTTGSTLLRRMFVRGEKPSLKSVMYSYIEGLKTIQNRRMFKIQWSRKSKKAVRDQIEGAKGHMGNSRQIMQFVTEHQTNILDTYYQLASRRISTDLDAHMKDAAKH